MKSEDSDTSNNTPTNNVDEEIRKRLQHLKEDKNQEKRTTDEEISKRLQNIKGPQPTTSDAELHIRLANLKGLPAIVPQDKVSKLKVIIFLYVPQTVKYNSTITAT